MPMWAQGNHQGPYEREGGGPESEDTVTIEERLE